MTEKKSAPQETSPERNLVFLEPEDYDQAKTVLYDSVLRLWDVVDNLSRLRPKHTPDYHVSIFGSARVQPDSEEYANIRLLAENLVRMGCHIVTGGGPGLMQAANEGATTGAPDNPERSIGIRVDLEFEQAANPFVGRVYEHKTFFSRLHHFVLRSHGFVVVGGGIGTTLELMMIWQLLQVRKLYGTPLVLVGDMWEELVGWADKHMVQAPPGYANPQDMQIPTCVSQIDEAIAIIHKDYDDWQAGIR